MGNPGVALVGVVLDENESATVAEIAMNEPQDRGPVADEVERVGHHDPVERWQIKRPREVGDAWLDGNVREALSELVGLGSQGSRVAVDRDDRAG